MEIKSRLDDSLKKLENNSQALNHYLKEIECLKLQKVGLEVTELEEYSEYELKTFSKDTLKSEVKSLETEISKLKPNLSILAEYKAKLDEYNSRMEDLDHVTNERDAIKKQYDELRKKRLDEFMAGFRAISMKLKEMYQVHFLTH